jgi:hypothetical protein
MTEPNGATAPGAREASTPVTGAQLAPSQQSEQQVEASLIADIDRLFGDPAAVSAAEETTTDLSNQAGGAEAHEAPAQTDSGTDTAEDAETEAEANAEDAETGDTETEAKPKPKTVPYPRLAKEIAKRKALEERLEALEAKAQAKEPDAQPAATPEDPELKPHRERATKADAELKAARELKALLKTNPDAVAEQIRKVDPRVGTDEESLREWLNDYADDQRDKLAEAKATLTAAEQAAGQRRQQMETTARAEARQQVETVAPWVQTSAEVLNQLREAEADEDTATVAQLRRKLDPRWNRFAQYMGTPEIKRHPLGLKVAVALAELDHRLELSRKPAASASAKPAAVRPGATAPKAAPRTTGQPASRQAIALKQFEQEPSEKALLAALDY